ncbi:hypothetical protein CcaverHIS002_0604620 [Cutaneotrichosporon cavernicola]|uniref:Adhesion regulating molecule n=1 Tax=Cutaneotrichosporon cavernicola TaxID=279322 RepID=A0AA48QY32_9TREE|nr:uncharacterized protein CcaverHIS019_0604070 [Cutaneotrichosporon cavernicola]BEI86175.1 hypothetical protein CcaverHIS002_0604620 [Cutaneotrichosporon cavernicola]BEI93948.1 hypothetical protein CcaverHIS019_0604070 [Cutaneotrichosporon cavernicola]BEJ01728.1 hypothetical protein CcaverHIS631_0604100 [Cutaneotrichosporon cavernicola]BEJ09495.1 hypothetical protein CcaverHIS641_0604100 [Cutaneotrichosporon cavernicola]
MAAVIAVPAGRSLRRSDNAKWVDPLPEKGIIEVNLDQGIVNFVWRNKATSCAEDELLIFPGEASFERVAADPTGRSFALKFSSSNQVHFFWLQSGTLADADVRATTDIDEFLKDPEYVPGSAPINDSHRAKPRDTLSTAAATTSSSPALASTSASTSGPAASASTSATGQGKKDSDMARLLFQWAENNLPIPEDEDASLGDILTPETVDRLLAEKPELAGQMAANMPPDLSLPGGESAASASGLKRVVGTPQFRSAVNDLEMALRNGTLPDSMMPWVQGGGGAWNLRSFLAALREVKTEPAEANKDDEKMDTDE